MGWLATDKQHGQPKMFASLPLRKHFGRVPEPVVFHIWLCGNKTRAELEKEDKVRLTVNNPSAKVR